MSDKQIFEDGLLKLEVMENSDSINVDWKGKSTERNPGSFLTPILLKVLKNSSDTNKRIVMDFRNLQYMNSSTITPIIKILERAKKSNKRLTVLYDKSLKWQELNFSAIEIFQTKDLRIQIKGIA
jgi:hypothetical protein